MATLEHLESALLKADAAGDVESARVLAGEIRRMRGNQSAAADLVANPRPNDPTRGMSGPQKFAAGAGKAMYDVGRAIGQPLGIVSQQDIEESRRLDAPLMDTGAGTAGNIVGTAATLAPAALIPGANTVVGAGLIGAGTGAALTPGTLEERGQAAFMGGLGGVLGQSIPAAYRTVKAAARPLTKKGQDKILADLLRKTTGDNAADVAARLRSAQPLVPGSMPTAAEVGESGGLAALQRAMSSANPEEYAQRGMEQASARLSALRGIAGDDAAVAAAKAARDGAAQPLYEKALNQAVTRSPELDDLLSRPIMRQAKAKAAQLAADNGEAFVLEAPAAAKNAIVDSMGIPLRAGEAANPGTYSARGLHYLKLALDDIGNGNATTALGRNEMRALSSNREQLLNILDDAVPDYAAARQAFAQGSAPVNQMKVGQALLEKVQPALAENGALARETGSQYATALRNSDQLAKKLTGSRGGLESVMTPDQMSTLQAVAQDLARKSNAQDLGRGVGSNTFQNFSMNSLAESSGMPSAVGGLFNMIPGVGTVANVAKAAGGALYKSKDEVMKQRMAQILLNPQETAGLMELALAQPGKVAQLLRNPRLQALPGIMGASLPAAE